MARAGRAINRVTLLAMYPEDDAYYPLASALLRGAILTSPLLRTKPEVSIVNLCNRLGGQAIAQAVLATRPDFLGVTCLIWDLALAERVAELVRTASPGCRVVLGGSGAQACAAEIMARCPQVDWVAQCEGEEALPELLAELGERHAGPLRTPGLHGRHRGRPYYTGQRPLIADLSALPSPLEYGPAIQPEMTLLLETSRGCAMACAYCFWGDRRMRFRDPASFQRDLELLARSARRPKRLWFVDSIFNLKPGHAKGILRLMRGMDGSIHVTMFMEFGLRRLDDEMIDLLLEARIDVLGVGLQSADAQALAAVNRGWNREIFLENMRRVMERRRGTPYLDLDMDLIFGLPKGNLAEFRDSYNFLAKLRPEIIHCFRLQVLPGTRLHDEPNEHGFVLERDYHVRESRDWSAQEMTAANHFAVASHALINSIYDLADHRQARSWLARLEDKIQATPYEMVECWRHWLWLRHGLDAGGVAAATAQRMQELTVEFILTLAMNVDPALMEEISSHGGRRPVRAAQYDEDGPELSLYRRFASCLPGPVLELGAGDGRICGMLARAGKEVTAVDRDAACINKLRRLAAGLAGGPGSLNPVQRDFRGMDLGRRFPLIILGGNSLAILEGRESVRAALACLARHLEANGLALVDWVDQQGLAASNGKVHELGPKGPTGESAFLRIKNAAGKDRVLIQRVTVRQDGQGQPQVAYSQKAALILGQDAIPQLAADCGLKVAFSIVNLSRFVPGPGQGLHVMYALGHAEPARPS
ncbi:hypothetical protein AAU61_15810 [Desulfocarbo indianensis]|nr:hypothetical protein AAU61_15810 [Desulfocarbo indianensis]